MHMCGHTHMHMYRHTHTHTHLINDCSLTQHGSEGSEISYGGLIQMYGGVPQILTHLNVCKKEKMEWLLQVHLQKLYTEALYIHTTKTLQKHF